MAINPTIQLTSKAGTVKKCAASNIMGDMRGDAIWYSANSSEITMLPYTLSNANKEWLVWNRGETIKVKFTADNTYDGQGLIAHGIPTSWKIDSLSGTVYIVSRKYQKLSDSKADIYANANRQAATVGAVLLPGDAILCSKGSYFVIAIETDNKAYPTYLAIGVVQAGLTE